MSFLYNSPKLLIMDIKKLLIGGILAGILFFLLGWLAYANLFANFFAAHPGSAGNLMRADKDLQFLYLVIGNLSLGFALAFILVKSNVSSMASGLVTAGIVGLLFGVGKETIMYATSTVISKTAMAADVAIIIAMWAIGGAVVGAVLGMGKKTV